MQPSGSDVLLEPLERSDSDRQPLAHFNPERKILGVQVGHLVNLQARTGCPMVDYPGNITNKPLAAITTVAVTKDHIGKQVVLMFENGDPERPVVLGMVKGEREQESQEVPLPQETVQATVDGETIRLTAKKEIVLKCGKGQYHPHKGG